MMKKYKIYLPQLMAISAFASILLALGCSTKDADVEKGEALYAKACKVCHAQGINGAPVLGNQANWRDRKDQGLDVLVEHATNGYGLMPAKGGSDLTEEEIRYVVKFMLDALKKE